MDCRITNLYTASFPGEKAGFSRRHDGLRDRIYHEAIREGLLAHREYAPAVMRGLTDEQRKALDAASTAALHCEAGGAEPPRDAVRVVDNVRTTRPELLLVASSPLAGAARGDAHAYRREVDRLRHEQVLHPMAPGRGYMAGAPRG
jgi:hypothetical protein